MIERFYEAVFLRGFIFRAAVYSFINCRGILLKIEAGNGGAGLLIATVGPGRGRCCREMSQSWERGMN